MKVGKNHKSPSMLSYSSYRALTTERILSIRAVLFIHTCHILTERPLSSTCSYHSLETEAEKKLETDSDCRGEWRLARGKINDKEILSNVIEAAVTKGNSCLDHNKKNHPNRIDTSSINARDTEQ